MLALMLMLVLAVNGGVFTGAILYSTWQTARFEHVIALAQKLWSLPFLS